MKKRNKLRCRGGPLDGREIEFDGVYPSWFGNETDGWYTYTRNDFHGVRIYLFRESAWSPDLPIPRDLSEDEV